MKEEGYEMFFVWTAILCVSACAAYDVLTVGFTWELPTDPQHIYWNAVTFVIYVICLVFVVNFPNRIHCSVCQMNFLANSSWVCAYCKNKNSLFRMMNRCRHCWKKPQSIKCFHCEKVVPIKAGCSTTHPAIIPLDTPIKTISPEEHVLILEENKRHMERVKSQAMVRNATDEAEHYVNRERKKRIAEYYRTIADLQRILKTYKAIAESSIEIPGYKREAWRIVKAIETIFASAPDLYKARDEGLQELAEQVENGVISKKDLKILTDNINDSISRYLNSPFNNKGDNNDGF